jgi:serine/threonine protein kinase
MKKMTWADLVKQERIGGGGFGDVYRAFLKSDNAVVAVKVLRDVNNPLALNHFRREIEALMSFTHEGVVRIIGYNLSESPPFFVMPLMGGGALIEWAGKLDQPLLKSVCRHLAEVLQHIHAKGHLHRDLKPANILVAADGTARVADFGLGNKREPGLTVMLTQNHGGTPGYMAPELLALGGRASAATDVYALGATMFHLITGVAPHTVNALDPKAHRADVDQNLRRTVGWMVHPNPFSRATLAQVLTWLGPAQPGEGPPRIPWKWKAQAFAVGGVIVAVAAVVGVFLIVGNLFKKA